ncbi:hypothetical protein KUCAC02_033685 [Chaenocephalus aceratus]|nr:hypothetical protein KUCAC02_033685 [Chaenocephalus aceratus]
MFELSADCSPSVCPQVRPPDVRVDFVECLMRFLPTEAEVKLLRQYEKDRKPLEALSDEDRFMMQFSRIERLNQRMTILTFMGNFSENLQMLTPQLHAIIAASVSIKSSQKLKKILELLETKSTDRKQTLLHYIANVVREKYPTKSLFYNELHYVDKAAAANQSLLHTYTCLSVSQSEPATHIHVSVCQPIRACYTHTRGLENVLLDVKELQRGMDYSWREFSVSHNAILKDFISRHEARLSKLNERHTSPSCRGGERPAAASGADASGEAGAGGAAGGGEHQVSLPPGKRQQLELLSELRRKQGKETRHVYEGKDGAIEDIITALKTVPFTARSAKRSSRFFCDAAHSEEHY